MAKKKKHHKGSVVGGVSNDDDAAADTTQVGLRGGSNNGKLSSPTTNINTPHHHHYPNTLPHIEPIHKNILLYLSSDPIDILHYRILNRFSFLVHRKYEREVWENVSRVMMQLQGWQQEALGRGRLRGDSLSHEEETQENDDELAVSAPDVSTITVGSSSRDNSKHWDQDGNLSSSLRNDASSRIRRRRPARKTSTHQKHHGTTTTASTKHSTPSLEQQQSMEISDSQQALDDNVTTTQQQQNDTNSGPKIYYSANQFVSDKFLQQVHKKQQKLLSNFNWNFRVQNWLFLLLVLFVLMCISMDFLYSPLAQTPPLYLKTHDRMSILMEYPNIHTQHTSYSGRSSLHQHVGSNGMATKQQQPDPVPRNLPLLLTSYRKKMRKQRGLGILLDLLLIHNGVRDKFYRGLQRENIHFTCSEDLSREIEQLVSDAARSESCLSGAHSCIARLIRTRIARNLPERDVLKTIEEIFTPDTLSKMELLFRIYARKQPSESIFQQQKDLGQAIAQTLERRLSNILLTKLEADLPKIHRQSFFALYDIYVGGTYHLINGQTVRVFFFSLCIFILLYVIIEKYVMSLDRAMLEKTLLSMEEVKSMSKEERKEWQRKYGYYMWRYSDLNSRNIVVCLLRELYQMCTWYSVVGFGATYYIVRILYSILLYW